MIRFDIPPDVADALLIVAAIVVIFALFAAVFDHFDKRAKDMQEQRDMQRLIDAANAEVATRARVRAGSYQPNQQE